MRAGSCLYLKTSLIIPTVLTYSLKLFNIYNNLPLLAWTCNRNVTKSVFSSIWYRLAKPPSREHRRILPTQTNLGTTSKQDMLQGGSFNHVIQQITFLQIPTKFYLIILIVLLFIQCDLPPANISQVHYSHKESLKNFKN